MIPSEFSSIKIGEINKLQVLRVSPQGLYLGFEEGINLLLPNKYVPENTEVGNMLDVFVYTDSDDRLIATTLEPQIKLNEIGVLKVREVNDIGAFMQWNIEKDILVPYRNQKHKLIAGKSYPVYLYLDNNTNRLVATAMLDKFLNNENLTIQQGDEVDLIIYEHTDLGYKVIINKQHLGLLFHNDIFQLIAEGQSLKGYIKTIREDGKIDVSLQPQGFQHIDAFTEKILFFLQKNNGKMNLTDNSSPEEIKEQLGMSKKQFKKAVGVLYKAHQIKLEPTTIVSVKK